jgi:hypothetical protein
MADSKLFEYSSRFFFAKSASSHWKPATIARAVIAVTNQLLCTLSPLSFRNARVDGLNQHPIFKPVTLPDFHTGVRIVT